MWFLPYLFCCHDLFTCQKFCACVDNTFLVPNEFHEMCWRGSKKYWSEVLHKDTFFWILISRCISLDFLSTSVALNISSRYLLFRDFGSFMSLFGHFRFWVPPIFQKYFALDTTLNTHEQNQVSRSKLIFQIHKQTHSVQCKHNHTPNFRK